MAHTADIMIERNLAGTPTFIKFNYKKYGEMLSDFFAAKGFEMPVIDKVASKNPALTGIAPRGCVTLEEFRETAIQKAHKFCDKYGIN